MAGTQTVECVRCGSEEPKEDAVAITDGGSMWKILCADCLRTLGVPNGYDLVRDITGSER